MDQVKEQYDSRHKQKRERDRSISPSKDKKRDRSISPLRTNKKREKDRSESPSCPPNNLPKPRKNTKKQKDADDLNEMASAFSVKQVSNHFKRYIFGRHINEKDIVFDLCCGHGNDLNKFAHQKISEYYGVDISEQSVREAKHRAEKNPRLKLYCKVIEIQEADVSTQLIKLKKLCDVVSCNFALHYFWRQSDLFFKSVSDNLRPKGKFLLTVLDGHDVRRYIQNPDPTMKHKIIQYRNLSKDGLSYELTFPDLVRGLKEYVIEEKELIAKCSNYDLDLLESFKISDIWNTIKIYQQNELYISKQDWNILNMYRIYVFVKREEEKKQNENDELFNKFMQQITNS